MEKSIYDFTVKDIDGNDFSLAQYKGKALLIVNVASKCGFTPQYQGLEKIHQDFQGNLVVLGFPCNQFGGQEPGNAEEIKEFCRLTYDVKFPLLAKIDVNGANAHPLYEYLKKSRPGLLGTEAIKWNFTKFLVNKNGEVVKRFAPNDTPAKIAEEIKSYL
jgi:glutathione peroxidase